MRILQTVIATCLAAAPAAAQDVPKTFHVSLVPNQ
jgi:hypothetical protein